MHVSHMTIKRGKPYGRAMDKIGLICNINPINLCEILGARTQSLAIRLSNLPDNEIITIVEKVKSGTPLRKLLPNDTVTIMLVLKKDTHTKLKEKRYIKLIPAILDDIANKE